MNNLLAYMGYNDLLISKTFTSDNINKSDEDKQIINLLRKSGEYLPDNFNDILVVRSKKQLDYFENLLLIKTQVIRLEHNNNDIYVLFR